LLEEIVIIKIRSFRIPNPEICFRTFTEFHISIAMYRTVAGSLSVTAIYRSLLRLAKKTHNDFTVPQLYNFNILRIIFLVICRQIYKDFKIHKLFTPFKCFVCSSAHGIR